MVAQNLWGLEWWDLGDAAVTYISDYSQWCCVHFPSVMQTALKVFSNSLLFMKVLTSKILKSRVTLVLVFIGVAIPCNVPVSLWSTWDYV